MNIQPTPKQLEIINFILQYQADKGFSPTTREIGAAVGWDSPGSVHHYLTNMRRAGFVDWQPGKARTLRVLWEEESSNQEAS